MGSLHNEIKKRMKIFDVHLPFAIKEVRVNEEGEFIDQPEESIEVQNNHITFAVSVEHSYASLNELVAKAKLAQDYGSLMCSQTFSQYPDKKALDSFTKAITPLLTAYTLQTMMTYLHKSARTKEVMEWRGYYSQIIDFTKPNQELKMILISLYVALKSTGVIKDNIPKVLQSYKSTINTYLELAQETPDPLQLVRAVNRLTRGIYYCALDQQDGQECILLRYTHKEDFMDWESA